MIDKNLALSILQSMPPEKILQVLALGGQSMPEQGPDMIGAMSMGQDEGIVPWNKRPINYDGGGPRQPIVGAPWAKAARAQAERPIPAGNMEADENIFLMSGGGS